MNTNTQKADRYFFSAISFYYFLVCLIGFGYTSYHFVPNNEWFLSTVLHGVITAAWITLLFVQTSLIAASNRKLHAKLGVLGLIVILLMIPSGLYLILYKVHIGSKEIGFGGMEITALMFIYITLLLGIAFRKKPNTHKRLLILGTMFLISAGINRVFSKVLEVEVSGLMNFAILFIPAFLLLIYDLIYRKKVFLVTILIPVLFLPIVFSVGSFWESPTGNALMKKLITVKEVEIDNLGMVGDALETGWDESIQLIRSDVGSNILQVEVNLKEGKVRFRKDNKTTFNWGGNSFPQGDLRKMGENINVKEGFYLVTVNTDSMTYSFKLIDD